MNGEIKGWVSKEFETLDFGEARLEKRFQIAMSDLSDRPELSILLASGSRANAKAVYRLLKNEKTEFESILAAHRDAVTVRSGKEPVLLAIQDTMSVNYATHTRTEDLGYCCEQVRGINVHSCLLVTPHGIPLGLIAQSTITRERNAQEISHSKKRARPIEEKESFRWLKTMQTAALNAPTHATLIHIADREGDIYELYALAQQLDEKFVIRAAHDRIDVDKNHLIKTLRDSTPVAKTNVTILANHKEKTQEREAILTIQYQHFNISKPQIRNNDLNTIPSVGLTLIRLAEESPPDGNAPIEWLLMTNLKIDNTDDALQVAEYYKQRWKIERFHYVLKSGCKIEKIQQRSVEGIELLILMYSIISIRIMQLAYLSRNAPETPCDLIFSEIEWKTLYRAAKRTKSESEKPPTMAEAVWLVAALGGSIRAKSDGLPGLKVIWIGLNSLHILVSYREYL
jgi:hypothetical protein